MNIETAKAELWDLSILIAMKDRRYIQCWFAKRAVDYVQKEGTRLKAKDAWLRAIELLYFLEEQEFNKQIKEISSR